MISLRKPRHWVVILFLGLMRLTVLLPFKVQFWIGRQIGKILYRLRRQRRAIAERNIKVCFPELELHQPRLTRAQHIAWTAQLQVPLGD